MNIKDLAELLLSSEAKSEMGKSIQMIAAKDYSTFYEDNQDIVRNILFIETIDEFLEFVSENTLDVECFCAAFLCAKGYGIQVGGYEDDLTQTLTKFFEGKGFAYPEILEIIGKEKIYTDCSDYDNFKKSLTSINKILDEHGIRVIVFEDFVYCDCQYTMLVVSKTLANDLISEWQSDNFEIYL